MEEETTLKDKVDLLNSKIDELVKSGQTKKFKLKNKPSTAQTKKGYIQVIKVNENREIDAIKVPVEEGTISIDGAPRIALSEYMLSYKGKPAIIIDSLSSEPYNPRKELDQAVRDKMLAAGYRLLANRVELGQVANKKKMSGAVIFIIIAAILVGGYLLLK